MSIASTEADLIIEKIDQELLKLYYASQNKTEYQFFDFDQAFKVFNELVLKEGIKIEFHDCSKYSVDSEEFKNFNKIREIKLNKNPKYEYYERKMYHFFRIFCNLMFSNELINHKLVNKYNFMLDGCAVINKPLKWEEEFKVSLEYLQWEFWDYSYLIDFDEYIKQVLIRKGDPTRNNTDNENSEIKPISKPTIMSINFIDLIIKGFYDPVDGDNLSNYFFREFKNAERDHYDAKTFFDGCNKGIIGIENELNRSKDHRRIYLKERIEISKEQLLNIQNDPSGYKVKGFTGAIANMQKEITEIDSDDYVVLLISTDRYLSLLDIYYIKNAICHAHLKVVPLNNSEVLQLMNANNLKPLSKELIAKLPPDSHQLILNILAFEDRYTEMKENINNVVKERDALHIMMERVSLSRQEKLTAKVYMENEVNKHAPEERLAYIEYSKLEKEVKELHILENELASMECSYVKKDDISRELNKQLDSIESSLIDQKNEYLKNIVTLLPTPTILSATEKQNKDEVVEIIPFKGVPHSQHNKDMTRYESKFFEITENFTEKKIVPILDNFNSDLFNINQRFKNEIIENITSLSQSDREFYVNRISTRINGIIEKVFVQNEKTGETKSAIRSCFEMISRCKCDLKTFISTLVDQTIEITKESEPKKPEIIINVFCEKMPIEKPIDHFKVFTEKKSTNGAPFLTNDQFNSFIDRAFHGNLSIPKQIINRGDFKIYIQWIFHEFYSKYNNYFPSSQCTDIFINLLVDNFEGWDFENIKINFAKEPKKMPK